MSFISISPIHINGLLAFTLVDSEFGEIKVVASWWVIAVVKAYRERDLPVGRNLALATIHDAKKHDRSIEFLASRQDLYCACVRPYAKERDEYLEKMLPLL